MEKRVRHTVCGLISHSNLWFRHKLQHYLHELGGNAIKEHLYYNTSCRFPTYHQIWYRFYLASKIYPHILFALNFLCAFPPRGLKQEKSPSAGSYYFPHKTKIAVFPNCGCSVKGKTLFLPLGYSSSRRAVWFTLIWKMFDITLLESLPLARKNTNMPTHQ